MLAVCYLQFPAKGQHPVTNIYVINKEVIYFKVISNYRQYPHIIIVTPLFVLFISYVLVKYWGYPKKSYRILA